MPGLGPTPIDQTRHEKQDDAYVGAVGGPTRLGFADCPSRVARLAGVRPMALRAAASSSTCCISCWSYRLAAASAQPLHGQRAAYRRARLPRRPAAGQVSGPVEPGEAQPGPANRRSASTTLALIAQDIAIGAVWLLRDRLRYGFGWSDSQLGRYNSRSLPGRTPTTVGLESLLGSPAATSTAVAVIATNSQSGAHWVSGAAVISPG